MLSYYLGQCHFPHKLPALLDIEILSQPCPGTVTQVHLLFIGRSVVIRKVWKACHIIFANLEVHVDMYNTLCISKQLPSSIHICMFS